MGPWPGDARVAVAFSFDAADDDETIPLRNGELLPGRLSQGEYGARVGVRRIVDTLEHFQVPATFFVPAVAAHLHPENTRALAAAGHEVALHGWIHERNALLDATTEGDLLDRSIDALTSITGSRPFGMRTPSWDFSETTLDLAIDRGLGYDSSLMADDDLYELVAHGTPGGIVEIPVEWIRDDAPYLTMDRFGTARPRTAPRQLAQIWIDEFDAAVEEGGLFQMTMRPHLSGHRSRIVALRELLEHIAAQPGVWAATHAQVAARVTVGMAR